MSADHQEKADEDLSGLQWLSRHRPEAMEHLLAFFKESGRHLDPKTRFLISVVTKVVNFTPRGLRQYIPRAMREGASRDEILDAILCAYPAAGLTNVLDAVDILRSIPVATHDPTDDQASATTLADVPSARWRDVASLEELTPGRGHLVVVEGQRLALFREGDQVHAISNACVHLGGQLADGYVEGSVVTCPLHGWQFELNDGQCLTDSSEKVDTFETRIEDQRVSVFL
ncbi:MAG: nitrite reductase small subunit NirD [Gemmatimonadetes bacterium]|nr:nitrite reductase small subunit NirD [Gemmatimonadota bacterium]MBT4608445.1 nitrite reductase small subunit NirD [Gemmatimonadota bacterium]MBT5059303.1 nitrite reductase small subunit NirD [Gemmatimonadota bacterium]MBT5145553.1 nitrite reductase small subunit NirD [Gemmatimonadota bacterium]MBT5591741.1 nitrite reductase small subunit NirD [Gemmatimonadota bacterium]